MPPDDLIAEDDPVTDLLIAYETALKDTRSPSRPDPSTAPPELRSRLQQGLAGVQLALQLPRTLGPTAQAETALPWQQLGRFEVRRELGRGSYGIVFLAHDPLLGRDVALKVPRPEVAFTPDLLERFRREARAVAGLEHPGIVPVHEVGTAGPVCFLVSAYCPGPTLAGWLQARREAVPFRAAAALLATLAEAIHHAHERGVVHRDLKPANILLSAECGVRNAEWETALRTPKITDFGLAKILREAATDGQTQVGTVLGTVCYMAPEQAAGHSRDVGPAADIYALGAILYELLTRQPPFHGETDLQTLQQVQCEDPIPVSRFRPAVPRDLETICLKALAREPGRRYASAAELADDLRRFLAGESVHARPPGRVERLHRWARRHPSVAALLVVSMVALMALAGLGVGAVYHGRLADAFQQTNEALVIAEQARGEAHAQRQQAEGARTIAEQASADAHNQRQQAEGARNQAEYYLYFLRLQQAHVEWKNRHFQRAEQLLDACPTDQRQWEWHYLKRLCHAERLTLRGHTQRVRCVAWSPGGNYLVSGDDAGTLLFWDRRSGKVLRTIAAHKGMVQALAFSPDGTRLASGGGDRLVRIWDPSKGEPLGQIAGFPRYVTGVNFSADGRLLACSCGDSTSILGELIVQVWDLDNDREYFRLDRIRYGAHCVALHPKRARLAVGGWDQLVHLCDFPTDQNQLTLRSNGRSIFCLAFSPPDGQQLASGDMNHLVRIWDPQAGQLLFTLSGHTLPVNAIAYNRDGSRLASASHDQTVRVWDPANGQELFAHQGHTDFIHGLAWSPDGAELATASADRTVKVWDARNGPETQVVAGPGKAIYALACSPDGRYLAYGGDDRIVHVHDLRTGQKAWSLSGHPWTVRALAFHPDGRYLASCGKGGTAFLWDLDTGREAASFRGHRDAVSGLALTGDGKVAATGGDDGTVRLWHSASGEEIKTLPIKAPCMCVAIRGNWLAVATAGSHIHIWDLAAGKLLHTLVGHTNYLNALAFHPDGRHLASAGADRHLILWDVASGRQVGTFEKHAMSVNALAFTPDGQRLASGCYDGTITIWDLHTRQAALTLQHNASPVRCLTFTPDGKRLLTAGEDGVVRIW